MRRIPGIQAGDEGSAISKSCWATEVAKANHGVVPVAAVHLALHRGSPGLALPFWQKGIQLALPFQFGVQCAPSYVDHSLLRGDSALS